MKYSEEHASALADLAEAGLAVAFVGTEGTVSGFAIQKRGSPRKYEALNLTESEAPTLLFAPETQGETPQLGATTHWGDNDWIVRDVDPVAPAGAAIMAYVVIAR